MIGKLKGRIDSYGPDSVIIDVAGVGYHVYCSAKTLTTLPTHGRIRRDIHRDARQSGPDPAGRICERTRARVVQAVADRAGRGHQGRAVASFDADRIGTRQRDRFSGPRDAQPRAGGRPEGRRTHRGRAKRQGAGLCTERSRAGPAAGRARRTKTDRGGRRSFGACQSRLRPHAGGGCRQRRDEEGG